MIFRYVWGFNVEIVWIKYGYKIHYLLNLEKAYFIYPVVKSCMILIYYRNSETFSHDAFRYLAGETPIHRLKALEKALDSEKPSKNAISVMLVSSSLKYFWAKS